MLEDPTLSTFMVQKGGKIVIYADNSTQPHHSYFEQGRNILNTSPIHIHKTSGT